jgi:hypothetical protein
VAAVDESYLPTFFALGVSKSAPRVFFKLDSYRAVSARAAATPTAKLESQIIGLQLIESTAAAQNAASIKNRAQLCRVRLSPFGVRLVVLLMLFISVASNAIGVESGAALFPARRRRAFI